MNFSCDNLESRDLKRQLELQNFTQTRAVLFELYFHVKICILVEVYKQTKQNYCFSMNYY